MEDRLIELLSTFGYPVIRQGSLSEDESYPESFFTFWNNDSADHTHYDNEEFGNVWNFDVNYYSTDVELTYSVLADARRLLKSNQWIVPSKGHDIQSDEPTHTGRGMEVIYLDF